MAVLQNPRMELPQWEEFVLEVVLSGLIWGDLSSKYLLLGLACLVGFAIIGFIDDYKKIFSLDSTGLSSTTKIFYQAMVALVVSVILFASSTSPQELEYIVPFFKNISIELGVGFVFLSVFILVGSSNAVNLTDGLDGLAILPVIIITAALGIIAWASGNIIAAEYLYIPYLATTGELLVLCGALIGAGIGFLGSMHTLHKFLWEILVHFQWERLLHL